ncbi:hypothetical protein D3C71_1759930 [compost metagenome]
MQVLNLSVSIDKIEAGGLSTCGYTSDGTPVCWGGVVGSARPTPMENWDRIALGGESHYCSPKASEGGKTYCWGRGSNGELGNGIAAATTVPVLVTGK